MKTIKTWSILILLLNSLSFADTYVKIKKDPVVNKSASTNSDSAFNSMRSVPTVNAQGIQPILRSLPLDSAMNQQIKVIQKSNPNQGLLIDAKTQKVIGVVPLSQQKDSPTKLSKFQTHKKQSHLQSMPSKVSIAPYQMQEETIHLHQ